MQKGVVDGPQERRMLDDMVSKYSNRVQQSMMFTERLPRAERDLAISLCKVERAQKHVEEAVMLKKKAGEGEKEARRELEEARRAFAAAFAAESASASWP
eukprot:10952269-Lingulodinium_polyedra.AAC.1